MSNQLTKEKVLASLPDKRFYEYAYHKFFTEGVEYETWQPDATWTYPDRDLLRFGEIITAQQQHIAGKRVLDLGCHLGYVSLFCLHNGARHVTGTNVRTRELDISREICRYAGYSNCQFVYSDIDNSADLHNLCSTVDTVLLCGLLYHVNNHMQLLKTIYDSTAKTLIIESEVHEREPWAPSIIFHKEASENPTHKLEPNKQFAFVGTPNVAWIKTAMQYVGYEVAYEKAFSYADPSGRQMNRYIITGTKKGTTP